MFNLRTIREENRAKIDYYNTETDQESRNSADLAWD